MPLELKTIHADQRSEALLVLFYIERSACCKAFSAVCSSTGLLFLAIACKSMSLMSMCVRFCIRMLSYHEMVPIYMNQEL